MVIQGKLNVVDALPKIGTQSINPPSINLQNSQISISIDGFVRLFNYLCNL
jgi:hypothetical protein